MRQPRLLAAYLLLAGCGGDPWTPDAPRAAPAQPKPALTQVSPPVEGVPRLLSLTGLFSDIPHGLLAPDVEAYTPRYPLWSDGAQKNRWIRLPEGTRIDTSDMDHWSFPVGTRFWKEFRIGGVRVETRMVTRVGPGPEDFTYAPYQWNAAGDDAVYMADGVPNAAGTGHDIPAARQCLECHGRVREHVLGFGAIQLSDLPSGLTIATLSGRGLLTAPAPAGFVVPGDAAAQAALGYLHGNCGHCHNPDGVVFTVPYVLRLAVSAQTVQDTGAYQTAVGVPTERFHASGITYRIARGAPSESAVFYRMSSRGDGDQMPPLATNVSDPAGLQWVRAFIDEIKE